MLGFTGQGAAGEADMMAAGASLVIRKPYDIGGLVAMVRNTLAS